MRSYSSEDEKQRKKKIIMIILLIILLLMLITSCTSSFFGTIGDLFRNEGNYKINEGNIDKDNITNQELRFDTDYVEMYLSDYEKKVSFFYKNISPSSFTCTTSDANIATCYASDGYIVVNPKGVGEVIVYLETETNGKKFRASTKVNVKEGNRYIELSEEFITIDMSSNAEYILGYNLVGLAGDMTVTSSDESVAKVIFTKDGALKIIPVGNGTADITITVDYNGQKYSKTCKVTVYGEGSSSGNQGGNTGGNQGGNTGGNQGGNTGGNQGGNTGGNDKPGQEKDNDSSLKILTITSGKLDFFSNKFNYQVGVDSNVNKISLNAQANSSKSKVSYTFNGTTVPNLNDLTLKTGNNVVVITVTAEDGSTSTYKVVINKAASSDNTLSSLTVNRGTLTPEFSKNILSYTVVVGADIDDITINSSLSDNKSKVKYVFGGQTVDNLNDLKLKTGKNEVEIIVTSEDGTSRTYTITVIKNPSDNNYLSSLKGLNYPLNETFDKTKNEYSMNVAYNATDVSLSYTLDDENSTVTYKLNGQTIHSLRNLNLNSGDNEAEIIVKSQSGKENTYKVTIHKPVRTIELKGDSHVVHLESIPYHIPFTIFEDGKPIPLDSYDFANVKVNLSDYSGKYEVHEGYITLIPDNSMVGKRSTLTLTYNNQSVSTIVSFEKKNDYYLNTYTNYYDIVADSKNNYRNIILNTNMFTGEVAKEAIPNGIRVYLKNNKAVYIDITSSDPNILDVDVDLSTANTASIVLKAIAKANEGKATIYVQGYAFGEKVNDFNIQVGITRKYFITLDAKTNGGFYNEFTTKYEFRLSSEETLDLSKYVPYKEAEGNCMYYRIKNYNTKADESGTTYDLDNVLSNFTSDLTLYAIFETTSEEIELKANKKLYLTDVDLFHNEEYYKLYNKDKIIYPGAQGSYVMTFENETENDITITGITLEEDTICVSKGCLNMGYIIKYSSKHDDNYTYYYGTSTEYTILNKGNKLDGLNQTYKQILFENAEKGTTSIKLEKGQGIEISLLWEWVDKEDELDTLIGNEAANLNDKYALTLSVDFETTNTHCQKN